ncbi:ergosterol biosynthesis protein [Zalaria obscura]|uniref:Ergosterol biosynthesis protein n=1 Tax=Zalaria obscura TaxID=2024903 RepID=A0ACC3SFX6_9PEZI
MSPVADMSGLLNYLPPSEGLLPKWLLFVRVVHTSLAISQRNTTNPNRAQISVVSMANSIQAYTSLGPTQRVYTGPRSPTLSSTKPPSNIPANVLHSTSPVTPLSARTFGTWTAITSVVRLYAAYHIEQQGMYELALWSFGVAWAHFMSEWLVFGTTRWGKGLAGPAVVSTSSLVWMWLQWDHYVKA